MAFWNIDPDHSCAAFGITHMGLARVRGLFTKIQGRISFDPSDRSRASVEVVIDVASVNTGVKKRDEHLLSADFFDQQKYPQITFRSVRLEFPGDKRCRVTGELTIHGATRQVSFEGAYAGPQGNPFGEERSIGFSGSTTINREDFGMMWGSEIMEGGGLIAGKEVQISLDVEADLAEMP